MSKFVSQTFQSVFRAVILCGLFVGLLFSCGEGIRLFPFPAAKIALDTDSEYKGETKTDYQKNIHRFENNQGNLAATYQRDNPLHYWANNDNALNDSPFLALATRQAIGFLPDHKVFNSHLFLSSPGSRAPPAL